MCRSVMWLCRVQSTVDHALVELLSGTVFTADILCLGVCHTSEQLARPDSRIEYQVTYPIMMQTCLWA
jgi:hypothetical protein